MNLANRQSKLLVSQVAAHLVVLLVGGAAALTSTAAFPAEAQANEPDEQADFHFKLAAGHFEAGNLDLATRELINALEIDENHAESHYLYGFIMFGRKRYDEAVDQFKRALKSRPQFFAARNHLGVAYLELGRFNEAIATLEPLLKEPTYTMQYLVYNNLGLACSKKGDVAQAEKHYKMSVFLNPNFCNGHRNLGQLAMQQRDYCATVEYMTEATTRCPADAELQMQLGEALAANGDATKANAAFSKCRQLAGETAIGQRCKAAAKGAETAPRPQAAKEGDTECSAGIDEIAAAYQIKIFCKSASFTHMSSDVTGRTGTTAMLLGVIPALKRFFGTYERKFIRNLMEALVLLRDLKLRGLDAGGLADSHAVYLCLDDYSAEDRESNYLGVLHHEFSSAVFKKNRSGAWQEISAPYDESRVFLRKCLQDTDFARISEPKLLSRGILWNYGLTNPENDFNTYAEALFTADSRLAKLAAAYPKVAQKLALLKRRYREAGFEGRFPDEK